MADLFVEMDHPCPSCRAPREGWVLKGAGSGRLRQGDTVPGDPPEGYLEIEDTCEECGLRSVGTLEVERDEAGGRSIFVTVYDLTKPREARPAVAEQVIGPMPGGTARRIGRRP